MSDFLFLGCMIIATLAEMKKIYSNTKIVK